MAKKTKPKNKQSEINKKTTMQELITKHPESIEVLFGRGMGCVGCPASFGESLEEGCIAHGINADEVVEEINKKLTKKKKEK